MSNQQTEGQEASLRERWSALPRYLHFFTLGYFLTNLFNIWAINHMAPHPIVGILALVGFCGGLLEHLTPYFPRLMIPLRVEKFLFRVPTIFSLAVVFFSLHPWLPWTLLFLGWSIFFWRAPGLNSTGIGFHIRHFGITHFGGTCVTVVWLLVYAGSFPFVSRVYSAPF